MDYSQLPMILMFAFGLGLLHSLDADHIMAVSNLASGQASMKASIKFCLRWALGHGFTLLVIGLLVFALGITLPASISLYAEVAVGFMLVMIGAIVLFDIFRQRAHIHFPAGDSRTLRRHPRIDLVCSPVT